MTHIFSRYRSPANLLDYTLARSGLALDLGQLYRGMPVLRDISERFVWRIGDESMAPVIGMAGGTYLADACLTKAYTWLLESDELAQRESFRRLQTVFCAGLFFIVPHLYYTDVRVNGKPWSWADGEDLGACMARGDLVEFAEESDDQAGGPDLGYPGARFAMLMHMYPAGGHLLLDINLKHVLWPPSRFRPERSADDAEDPDEFQFDEGGDAPDDEEG